MQKVTVYYFMKYDPEKGKNVRSSLPATRKAIALFAGEVLEETAREVDVSCLDGNGQLKVRKCP